MRWTPWIQVLTPMPRGTVLYHHPSLTQQDEGRLHPAHKLTYVKNVLQVRLHLVTSLSGQREEEFNYRLKPPET